MYHPTMKKDSSYSQFRKKNSHSKTNLHKSMLDIDHSLSLIADDKTQQLLSLQTQLQSIVRNRSLSAKPSPRHHTQESIKLSFQKNQQSSKDRPLNIKKRNSIHALINMDNYQKTNRSIQFQPFNETFEIIEQSEIHNEEDNGIDEGNKVTSVKRIKNQKPAFNRNKNSNQLAPSAKLQKKLTINDLDETQKRLESAKKKAKLQLKDIVINKKIVKKQQFPTKSVIPQKTQRRIHRINSEAVIITERPGLKAIDSMHQKQVLTPKPIIKKKLTLTDSAKLQMSQKQASNQLIPTKLVNQEQKQKLLKELDRIKDSIKQADICADNMEGIRKMLKTIQGMIN